MNETLSRNLNALSLSNPAVAELVRASESAEAEIGVRYKGKMLCSKRPYDEAVACVKTIDPAKAGFIIVPGFGAGFHVIAALEATRGESRIVCFEPDIPLLRYILEHYDWADWLRSPLLTIITEPDTTACYKALCAEPMLVTAGVAVLEHPANMVRLKGQIEEFAKAMLEALSTVRVNLTTSMGLAVTSFRNLLMNLDHYATDAGITDLEGVCAKAGAD
jgi:hypothetical protein